MEKKNRLHRKCAYCKRVLPVATMDDDVSDWDDTVMWQTDPFESEIHQDYTKMWLCGRCRDAQADEI